MIIMVNYDIVIRSGQVADGTGKKLFAADVALKGDRFDVIVNATSAGHSGQMPLMPPGLLAPGGDCYDLSYGPAHAPFAAWAVRQNAARIEDGLGMLVGQAASAFEIWRGVEPAWEAVIVALRRAGWLRPGSLVALEVSAKEHFGQPQGLEVLEDRRYGRARVLLLEVV